MKQYFKEKIGRFILCCSLILIPFLTVDGQVKVDGQKGVCGINLSFFKRLSTQPNDSVGGTCFNLGLVSSMNRLDGVGVNLLGANVSRNVSGLQVAGLWNTTGQNVRGLQVSGITHVTGDTQSGVSVAGLVGINGRKAMGVQVSGLVTINGDDNIGVGVSGLMNLAGEHTRGVFVTGIGNISGTFQGVALSGMLNATNGKLSGLQMAGLVNIGVGFVRGVQLSAIGNVAGSELRGVQIGAGNLAVRARGVQIGLVNYYKERLDGIQLGLVNANPQTRVQLMLYGGNATGANVGVRFKNPLFYTILGLGAPSIDWGDKFSGALFYRAGLEIPVYGPLHLSGDLGFRHTELFKNHDAGYPRRLYSLEGRVNLEYRLTSSLGLFLTGGYGWDRQYGHSRCYEHGAIVEGGVILFSY